MIGYVGHSVGCIEQEVEGISLGDKRLNKRAKLLLGRFAADPQASINAACQGAAETEAAYRFFDNDDVDEHKVLAPHGDATLKRMAQHPVVLIPQDTTELDYTRKEEVVEGAGPLNDETRTGFLDHVMVAFTPQRVCLGVVDMNLIARDFETFRTCKERKYDPIEEKESFRWLQGYRKACAIAEQLPQTLVVSISDREGDIYECLQETQVTGSTKRAGWIIRSNQDRALPQRDPQAGPSTYRKLRKTMRYAPVLGRRKLKLAKTPKRKAREATVTIRAQQVTLKGPYRPGGNLPDIIVNAIYVRETRPPAGQERLEWLLFTDQPIDSLQQVLTVVSYYGCRFEIERFFQVYKSGCTVEDIQLETADRLKPCLALYKIVAWRVLYLTMLGRECPELPCDKVFADEEWKSVWMVSAQSLPPPETPTLAEFLKRLAMLGGYNGRKHDGPPGPKAVWIGIRRMTDFASAWKIFGPDKQKYL